MIFVSFFIFELINTESNFFRGSKKNYNDFIILILK
jgi:hypothetical protein